MVVISIILQGILILGLCALVLFVKHYFPSYMNKKGENLATKEDIAEITKKTEEVQKEFKEQFELFSSDIEFKYNFYVRQYSELYCFLYAIVIQSEYVRFFLDKKDGKSIPFDEAPFIEVSPTEKRSGKVYSENGIKTVELKSDLIETDISQFNKKSLVDYIVSKGELASQELLKLAVSYRFAHEYYSGNKSGLGTSELSKTADDEEFRLIRELICCIVKEYNSLRKSLKMTYNEEELNTGIPHC